MARRKKPRSRAAKKVGTIVSSGALLKIAEEIMSSVDYSIRSSNAPRESQQLYTLEDIGKKICANPVASKAYKRITEEGYHIKINYDCDKNNPVGRTINHRAIIEVFVMNNLNVDEVVGTIVHESVHVEYRNKKRISSNTQYEEYRAIVREELYRNSQNPHITTRPTMEERLELWETVKQNYPKLSQGKYPFGGSV